MATKKKAAKKKAAKKTAPAKAAIFKWNPRIHFDPVPWDFRLDRVAQQQLDKLRIEVAARLKQILK